MLDQGDRDLLLGLLAWWREAGADAAIDAEPFDWMTDADHWPGRRFAWPERDGTAASASVSRPQPPPAPATVPPPHRMPPPTRPGQPPPAGGARPFTAFAPDAATTAARTAAAGAATLEALQGVLAGFDGCGLKATAKSLCFYRGSPQARLMIIGEAPGRDEDHEGRPFVGRAGQLLDKMLAAIGLSEADVHITNIVYWRPPGNRTPTPQEAQVCRPFLERQAELVAPDVVLTLGGPASSAILGVVDGIMKVRGKWREVPLGGRPRRIMPTLHPAFLLRTPLAKRQAWRDLLAVKAALRGEA
jgi:DNA polymerase